MPLFIFIAGYFHRNQKILSKIYFFLISGLLLRFLLFIEYQVLLLYNYEQRALTIGVEGGVPWFMLAMAAFTVMSYIVKDCNPKIVLPVSIIMGCFAGYDKSVNDFLVLSRIIVFFPFYYAGSIVRKNDVLKSTFYLRTKKKQILSIILLMTFLIVCWLCIKNISFLLLYFRGCYPYSFIWNSNFLNIKSGLIRLLCYVIAVLMGYSLIILTPKFYLPVITSLGSKTLQIYFWHMLFIQFLRKIGIVQSAFRGSIILLLLLGVFLTLFLGLPLFSFPMKHIRNGCLKYKVK